jgi:DNA-binding transcriptional LysR family regulator
MDFRSMQYILTVMEEGSISKAARKLYISQPSLSQCIIMQERKLGASLFDRTKTPIAPTLAGELFLSTAKRILELTDDLEKEIADIKDNKKGRLVISTTKIRAAYLLPGILPLFAHNFPGVEIVLREEIGSSIENSILSREADVGILILPVHNQGIEVHHLFDERILLIAPSSENLPHNESGRITDLTPFREKPFILYRQGQRMRSITDQIFLQAGFAPRIVLETQTAEAILNFVSVGMGMAFIPEIVFEHHSPSPRPLSFPFGDPFITSSYAFAWRKDGYLNWAARAFLDTTLRFFGENARISPSVP